MGYEKKLKKLIKAKGIKELYTNPLQLVKYLVREKGQKSHLRCHKLLYFAYKEAILKYDTFLFDEEFEAWKYGPVLRKYYDFFKKFQDNTHFEKLENFFQSKLPQDGSNDLNSLLKLEDKMINVKDVKSLLDYVPEKYENEKTYNLIDISHDKYRSKAEDLIITKLFFLEEDKVNV